ncbi:hypothetical protein PG995_007558 [Apiospora arundinis]
MGAVRKRNRTKKCQTVTRSATIANHVGDGGDKPRPTALSSATSKKSQTTSKGSLLSRATKKLWKFVTSLPNRLKLLPHTTTTAASRKMSEPAPSPSGSMASAAAPSLSGSIESAASSSNTTNTNTNPSYPPPPPSPPLPSSNTHTVFPTTMSLPTLRPPGEPFARNGRIINAVHTPTVQQCKQIIAVQPNSTLFHSGGMAHGGYLDRVLAEDRPYLRGYTPLSRKHTSHDFTEIYTKRHTPWCNLSRALAEESSGTAYVLLPPGDGWGNVPEGGHFFKDELPHLGVRLERLIRINAIDPNHMEVVWTQPAPTSTPQKLQESRESAPSPEELQDAARGDKTQTGKDTPSSSITTTTTTAPMDKMPIQQSGILQAAR